MSLDGMPPPSRIVADDRPASDDEDSLEDEGPPELAFPPFPKLPSGASLIPFSESEVKGAWVPPFSANREEGGKNFATPHDHQGLPLVEMERPYTGLNHTFEERENHKKMKRRAANDRRKENPSATQTTRTRTKKASESRLKEEDCWKIGDPLSGWHEPSGTSSTRFEISSPPFSRLIHATADFISSRDAELQYKYNKRLFDIIRDLFGIRTTFIGRHWPGGGPNATIYASRRRRYETGLAPVLLPSQRYGQYGNRPPRLEETCVLLREPENSVRQFMTFARKEVETAWEFEPALKLATMTAAFISFLTHHNVFPEPALHSAFKKAAAIARSGPGKLIRARELENILVRGTRWNRASWAVWGGSHSGPEPGGPEKEIQWGSLSTEFKASEEKIKPEDPDEAKTGDSDEAGGWTVDEILDKRLDPPTKEDAINVVHSLIQPFSIDDIHLIQNIEFSNRIIIAVLPPQPAEAGAPAYISKCYRFVTIKSPLQPTFKKSLPIQTNRDSAEDEDGEEETDKEQSISEPEEMVIWVEAEDLAGKGGGVGYVGMSLQGRWGLMGLKEDRGMSAKYGQWWAFKTSDFVLPAM
ncbi:hypothetical protein J007_06604 [Cryptococcus neoformans]|nr:hypothetical protein J007_06604 [Cryptococcus neoformans var. grubii]OXC57872.1 hypothetical protein C358_06697 [Cryptococcus neoformans var. grubii MW-RSA852]